MMKSQEVKEALSGKSDNDELEELVQAIEITEDDDLQSLSKKQQAQISKLVKYFTKKITNAENNAVEKATKDTREKEAAEIRKFSDANPGMKNQDVVDLMQPLYNKGKTLQEAYDAATKALGLDPTTGEPPKEETAEEKKARGQKEAKAKAKDGLPKTSAKSDLIEEPPGDDDKGGSKKDTPLSLDDALAANSAAYIAKHGDPFDKKEE